MEVGEVEVISDLDRVSEVATLNHLYHLIILRIILQYSGDTKYIFVILGKLKMSANGDFSLKVTAFGVPFCQRHL